LQDEAQVINLVRAGSNNAFTGVVEHYQRSIIRYLHQLTGEYEVALDLAQDTFVRAYQGILKTDAELSLKPWLYKIATNLARQHYRRKRILSLVPFAYVQEPESISTIDKVEESLVIGEALRQVPPEQRSCIVLHFVEGLTYREIGEVLGASEDAVRKRVVRGCEKFRQAYRQQEVVENGM
jgi:RNA polymerase sigma-70 factor (ECF subfamily)